MSFRAVNGACTSNFSTCHAITFWMLCSCSSYISVIQSNTTKLKKKKCTLYSWLKFYCMIKTEIYCLNTCTYFFFFFVLMSICMANIHLEILKKQFLIKWCLQVCEICFINTNKIYKFFFQAFMVSTNFV